MTAPRRDMLLLFAAGAGVRLAWLLIFPTPYGEDAFGQSGGMAVVQVQGGKGMASRGIDSARQPTRHGMRALLSQIPYQIVGCPRRADAG